MLETCKKILGRRILRSPLKYILFLSHLPTPRLKYSTCLFFIYKKKCDVYSRLTAVAQVRCDADSESTALRDVTPCILVGVHRR